MFELQNVKGTTWFFDAYTNLGVFRNSDDKVILIDSGDHKRTVRTFDRILAENGLVPDIIICTHAHVDHIAGNRFFSEKYGCKILCTSKEWAFIKFTDLEPDIFYNGCSVNKKLSPYYQAEPSDPEMLTESNLPKGIEIFDLPGHAWDMIAVKTADNVLFLADSIMSKETWESHKLPFFNDVNKSIETLEKIKTVEADLYIPSHDAPLTDIVDLADYNIKKFKERKETIYNICNGNNADEIFVELLKALQLEVPNNRYNMYYIMLRHYLQALIDDKAIMGEFNGEKYIYCKK